MCVKNTDRHWATLEMLCFLKTILNPIIPNIEKPSNAKTQQLWSLYDLQIYDLPGFLLQNQKKV